MAWCDTVWYAGVRYGKIRQGFSYLLVMVGCGYVGSGKVSHGALRQGFYNNSNS